MCQFERLKSIIVGPWWSFDKEKQQIYLLFRCEYSSRLSLSGNNETNMLAILEQQHPFALSNRARLPFSFPLDQSPSLAVLKRTPNTSVSRLQCLYKSMIDSIHMIQRTMRILTLSTAGHGCCQCLISPLSVPTLCRHFMGLVYAFIEMCNSKHMKKRPCYKGNDYSPRPIEGNASHSCHECVNTYSNLHQS